MQAPTQLSPVPVAHFLRPPSFHATQDIFQIWGWDQGRGFQPCWQERRKRRKAEVVQELDPRDTSRIKAWESWASVPATCTGPSKLHKLHFACFRSFCFRSAGLWNATPKTPCSSNTTLGLKARAWFFNVRLKALGALAPNWTRGPVLPAMGSPAASSSGRGGWAVGVAWTAPHGEYIDFPPPPPSPFLFLSFFFLIPLKELDLKCWVVFL